MSEYQPAMAARDPKHGKLDNERSLNTGHPIKHSTAVGITPGITSHQPSGRPVV